MGGNGMEWNTVLGLSASLLAGRVTRVPPNYPLVRGICPSLEHQDPEALSGALRRQNFPSTGGGAMPALGAMQEPIPDLKRSVLPIGIIHASWKSRKPDLVPGHKTLKLVSIVTPQPQIITCSSSVLGDM